MIIANLKKIITRFTEEDNDDSPEHLGGIPALEPDMDIEEVYGPCIPDEEIGCVYGPPSWYDDDEDL